MKKEIKIWYCGDNDFYYISYNGKEIASITGVKTLLINHLNNERDFTFINESKDLVISEENNEKVSITQGDGLNSDNIILIIGREIYYLQITGNCIYAEFKEQTRTKLFAHKIWMEF